VQHTFSDASAPIGSDGLLRGGLKQFGVQVLACVVVAVYATAVTAGLLFAIKKFIGLRAAPADEREGLDHAVHGEQGYAG